MFWMLLILLHVAVFLIMNNRDQGKKDLENKINGPFIPVTPSRFSGCRDEEQERIAKRNREAVDEIERAFKTVSTLRKLNKL
jgi:hypothetical protein